MAGKLSFSIAINLLTENFKRGTNQVKAAFRSMQMQVLTFAAALGAGGIGLSNLVSRFVDVARETNRVTTALKNVSGSMGQFADNQRYLIDLAKKYGLEINALTGNFAKFTAAASVSGMGMEEQRKIFESVSRACTAFSMSADDSNGVFLALSQMMSKGKISSEELRLQMGERLPIALQAMAKAAGVSVGGLDKLMKQGKLMSKDVLPKFAEALNDMIPNVDTDNLETSVNRLKNVFTELVNGTDVQSKYKALIDWLTGAVKSMSDNIKSVITYLVAAILVMVTSRLVNKIIAAIAKAEIAAKVSARRAAKEMGVAFDETAWKAQKTGASIKMAFSKALGSLRAMMISFAPTAIIAALGYVVAKLTDMYNETNRVKGAFDEYKKRISASSSLPEVAQLKVLQDLYSKNNDNLGLKQQYLNKINSILGTELTVQDNINKAISERISLLEATAKAEVYAREVAESESEIKRLGKKAYGGHRLYEMAPDWAKVKSGDVVQEGKFAKKYGVKLSDGWSGDLPIKNELDKFVQLSLILKDARENLSKATEKTITKSSTPLSGDPTDDKKTKKTELQKQEESYKEQLSKLKSELEIGSITQAEYNKALGQLNIKMYAEANGTNDKKVLESEYYKNLKTAAEKAVKDQDKNAALVEFEKVQKDYNDKVEENKARLAQGLISQDQFNKSIVSLAMESANSAASIKGIGGEANAFIYAMKLNAQVLASPIKTVKPRDTTFDYKKSKVDIASETLDKAKEEADALREYYSQLGVELSDEMAKALTNVPSLEKALKIAQVKEDIKDFSKELNESVYSGVKDIASGADRMVSAFKNLSEVMNDVDASGWERIMAVWNAMTNVVDSFMSILKMIESLTEITNKLTEAKQAEIKMTDKATASKITEAAVDTTTTGVKVVNSGIKQMADTKEAATAASTAGVEVAANTAKGASKAGASAAGLPFPANIIAIGTAIAAAVALFASIPKFANGGIVSGGPSSGDKILARVNAGEMVLNQGQQSKLWQAIQSGRLITGASGNSSITTKIRGRDLILLINNERKSQGKKPLV